MKNIISLSIANGLYAMSQWAMILIIARVNGAEISGLYALVLAISTPIFLLLNLQLRNEFISDLEGKFPFSSYFRLRIYAMLIALVLSLVIGVPILYSSGNVTDGVVVLLITSLLKFFDGLSDICYGLYQKHHNFKCNSTSLILRSFGVIFVFAVFNKITGSLFLSLSGVLVVNVVIFFVYDALNFKIVLSSTCEKVSGKKDWIKILTHTWRLGLSNLFDTFAVNGQRIIMSYIVGIELLGFYAPILQLIVIPQIFLSSVNQYYFPRLVAQRDRCVDVMQSAKYKILIITCTFAILFILFSLLCGGEVLKISLGVKYRDYAGLLLVLSMSGFFWYLCGAYSLFLISRGLYSKNLISVFLGTLLTLISTLILVPWFGLYGAATSLVAGYASRFLIQFVLDWRVRINC